MLRLLANLHAIISPYIVKPPIPSRKSKPSTSLLSLPLELQTEILYYIELEDILHVRQVCRVLSSATRRRSLWMSILRNPPPPMDLYSYLVDRNLETSTGSDLEAIIRDCLCGHKRWGDPSLARVREFESAERSEPIVIIPGGRWAITFARSGDVLAADLHTPDYRSSPLFPGCTEKKSVRIVPVLETQEAGFHTQLKMAVCYTSSGVMHARVWLIRPSYDTTGHVDGLQAELLSAFSAGPRSQTSRHSMSGSFLAFRYHPDNEPLKTYAVIIDWEKANGQEDYNAMRKYVFPIGPGQSIFSLLPTNTLLTNSISSKGYQAWDLLSMEPVFRVEDAVEGHPIYLGGRAYTSQGTRTSLPVFCKDGTTRIASANLGHFTWDVISNHTVEHDIALQLPPLGQQRLRLGFYGVDKRVMFGLFGNIVVTIKAARFGPPSTCSMTMFQSPLVPRGESQGHIDWFSGVTFTSNSHKDNTVLIDFPPIA